MSANQVTSVCQACEAAVLLVVMEIRFDKHRRYVLATAVLATSVPLARHHKRSFHVAQWLCIAQA